MTELEYLAAEAFEFSLYVNPEAGSFISVEEIIKERDPDDDEWVSLDQKEQAIKTNKVCIGYVYPNGSVAFFRIWGTDVAAVVAKCAELCRDDRMRFAATKATK